MPSRLLILGSTGSIGTQTIEVVEALNATCRAEGREPAIQVVGLAAGANAHRLREQARRLGVRWTALASGAARDGEATFMGPDAPLRLVREVECDVVLSAIVGVAGLEATLAAVELGRDVALANKETLVAAGELVIAAAAKSGARLLPVDSEHSGVWQCLARGRGECPPRIDMSGVERVVLTASGGPFRAWSKAEIDHATPREALRHPTWSMGSKVTIDSASLMNKALEVIEARWLFGLDPGRIGVLVHPQSIVHAFVEMRDGSVLAQMGAPDMKTPIQHALTFPERCHGPASRLDLSTLARLDFEPPDLTRFPALRFAYDAMERGGTAGAILNAANEAVVDAFLRAEGRIPFGRLAPLVAGVMERVPASPLTSLGEAFEADRRARECVRTLLEIEPCRPITP
jgi:1-deoxy-D-xylulose-5-phosphate reductoisomerase